MLYICWVHAMLSVLVQASEACRSQAGVHRRDAKGAQGVVHFHEQLLAAGSSCLLALLDGHGPSSLVWFPREGLIPLRRRGIPPAAAAARVWPALRADTPGWHAGKHAVQEAAAGIGNPPQHWPLHCWDDEV